MKRKNKLIHVYQFERRLCKQTNKKSFGYYFHSTVMDLFVRVNLEKYLLSFVVVVVVCAKTSFQIVFFLWFIIFKKKSSVFSKIYVKTIFRLIWKNSLKKLLTYFFKLTLSHKHTKKYSKAMSTYFMEKIFLVCPKRKHELKVLCFVLTKMC